MRFHREVFTWWCEHHPTTVTEANAGRVWLLAQAMLDAMRGERG